MFSFLKPAPDAPRLPAARIDPEYRRLRWQVFTGIFIGYAGYYLVLRAHHSVQRAHARAPGGEQLGSELIT